MILIPIMPTEDKANKMYDSDDCQQLLSMYDDSYPKTGFNIPRIGYFVVRQNQIVGSCSLIEQPKDGYVEIAYWTFKTFEGQGVASFACKELIAIAYRANLSVTIIAKTAPVYNASTRILENNNFLFTGIVQDNDIGDAWLWTHQKTN